MNKREFVEEISKLRPGSTFLVLHKYRNEHGETADYNIIFHISYKNALERSIKIVEAFAPTSELQEKAQAEILNSYQNSLNKIQTTPIEEIDDAYYRYRDEIGNYINGIKLHIESDTLHLFGLIHQKRIIVPGTYKKVNSRPLTIEKKKIQRLCPVGKFRQFRINPSQLERIKVQHLSLLPPEDVST